MVFTLKLPFCLFDVFLLITAMASPLSAGLIIVSLTRSDLIANFSLWERFVVLFFFVNFMSSFCALFLQQSIVQI